MITTTELARQLAIKPESIRAAVARVGTYYGLAPVGRLPNGRLAWPDDAASRLIAFGPGEASHNLREGGPLVDSFPKGTESLEIGVGSEPSAH